METKNSSIATLDPILEDQTIDGLVSELERQIDNSQNGNGECKGKTISIKRLWHMNTLKENFGFSSANSAGSAENGQNSLSKPKVNGIHVVEFPIPATEKLFDEISLAGEIVGFGIGTCLRLFILSVATIFVVGLFSIFVFLHAVVRGLMMKHWDTHPQ